MSVTLRPYPEYKESGLLWAPQIPSHWHLIPNRGLVKKRKVLVGRRHTEYKLLSLTKQGIIIRDLSTLKGKFSADMGTSQQVRGGDLVFCLFDVPETPRTVGLSRHDGMITSAYTVFEVLSANNSAYFELFYRAMDDRKLLSPLYSGLRNTIPIERFLSTKSPQPPSDEQSKIVRLIHHVDQCANKLIRAKRREIELLNEQKQAIVQRFVTGDLNGRDPQKYSGIRWLGQIPAHWTCAPAKFSLIEVDERSDTGTEELLSVSHITGVSPRSQKNITMFMALSYVGHKLCRPGDLVVNTMWAWMGALGVSAYTGIVSPSYAVYRQRHNATFVPGFLDQLLRIRPYVSEFVVRSTGIRSSRLRLYPEQLLRIPLVQPPLKEQERILQKVQMETAVLEHSMQRAQREIELIREYRTRLISDVVTGRLDVRGVEVPETDLKEVSEAINAEMAVDLETIDEEEPAAVEEGEDAGD